MSKAPFDDSALMETTESHPALRQPYARRWMDWLQTITFLLGAVLLYYVISRTGVQPIFAALSKVGFAFFLVVAINGLRQVLRTIAMSVSVPRKHRHFTFLQAFAARLGGESISFLTFGGLTGQATKIALLRRRVPLVHGVPALVVDNVLYNLSVVLMILGGACLVLFTYSVPLIARGILIVIAAAAFLGLVAAAMAMLRRVTLLTRTIDGLARRGFRPRFLKTQRDHIYWIELTVYEFYKHRRPAFLKMIGLDLASHLASVLEVYVILKVLGVTANVSAAYIIESLTKVITFAFGFVPGTIGVYETGNAIILRILGFTTAVGVALAIVRKAASVFWTVIGVLVITWGRARAIITEAALARKRIAKDQEEIDVLKTETREVLRRVRGA